MQDIDMEPVIPEEPPHSPIDGLYITLNKVEEKAISAIEEATKKSIKEIKQAKKESTVLSYRMLIAGAVFGFLGSYFVATLLRWYDASWCLECGQSFLGISGIIAFVISGVVVYFNLKKAEQGKK